MLVLGLLPLALVLIPAGMDALYPERPRRSTKRGRATTNLSVLPAVAQIEVTAVVIPTRPVCAILAIAAEALGIALYL